MSSCQNNWVLHWESPQSIYQYEPIYLANSHFGGLLDLTGTDINLWSSRITGLLKNPSKEHESVLFPVTALRTEVYYRNEHFRQEGFWVSNAGILSDKPEYIHHNSMPHKAQVYDNRQSLDIKNGYASTSGVVFPGSYSSYKSGSYSERVVPFSTKVGFLKDSPLLGMFIRTEPGTDILFNPMPILEDRYVLDNSGKGIYTLGNEMDENVCLRQKVILCDVVKDTIKYRIEPENGDDYTVVIKADGAVIENHFNRPCFVGKDSIFLTVAILAKGQNSNEVEKGWSAESFFDEQEKRWHKFWSRSEVNFPKEENLWQQRYRVSLFYVAQSVNDAPVHPVGLSKPMIPYWFGSFHDTDTYFCRPLLEAGHGEQGSKYLNYRYRTLAKAYEIAKQSNAPGAQYPWQSDPEGNGECREIPLNNAIIAVEAWNHFAFTGNTESLSKAQEILEGVMLNLLRCVNESTKPLSLIDEFLNTFSETIRAKHAGEIVLALRSVAFNYLKACKLSGNPNHELAAKAERVIEELLPYKAKDGSYSITRDGDPEYMRCPSITLGSFPLHCLDADEAMNLTFEKELSRVISVFSWMPQQLSIVASQLERKSGSCSAWNILTDSLVHDKAWYAVDEWENRRTARPQIFVTCAGGHCSAIHAMLIAETGNSEWTVFPGIPDHWEEISFSKLRIRAGWQVSASLIDGKVVFVEFYPEHGFADDSLCLRIPSAHKDINIEGLYDRSEWIDGVLYISPRPPK